MAQGFALVTRADCLAGDKSARSEAGSYSLLIVQELCGSRGGRPNEPSGFRGRKAILNHASALVSACP